MQLKREAKLSTVIGLMTKHADNYIITNTFVTHDNVSEPISGISPTYIFSQFIEQVTINSGSDRPCCKRDFNPILNFEPIYSVGDLFFEKVLRSL